MATKQLFIKFCLFLLALTSVGPAAAQDAALKEAEVAYTKEDYKTSIQLYEGLLKNNGESAEVYYNLGNAYYKDGQIAPAILNYERALLLAPGDKDIRFNLQLAKAHRIKVMIYQYLFAALLSLIVIFSVKAVGVLLVTAMLITPAAAARNLASSYGRMLWISVIVSIVCAIAGLLLSAQEWLRTAAGATIVICACLVFCISLIFRRHFRS